MPKFPSCRYPGSRQHRRGQEYHHANIRLSCIGRCEQTADAAISRFRLRTFADASGLNERQVKPIDRLDGWTGHVTPACYRRITRCNLVVAELDVSRTINVVVLTANEPVDRHITYRFANLP